MQLPYLQLIQQQGVRKKGSFAWEFHRYAEQVKNGIRVMLGHGGIGVGKPGRPDYPYDKPASLNNKHKLCIYASIGLAALAMLYGLQVMFGV